jgi:hypothetical protein
MRFDRIKCRGGRCERTAPGFTRLLECYFKQSHNQVDKDEQFFPVYLSVERITANRNSHTVASLPPPMEQHRGLIALSAICTQKSQSSLSKKSHQSTHDWKPLPIQYSGWR